MFEVVSYFARQTPNIFAKSWLNYLITFLAKMGWHRVNSINKILFQLSFESL